MRNARNDGSAVKLRRARRGTLALLLGLQGVTRAVDPDFAGACGRRAQHEQRQGPTEQHQRLAHEVSLR